MIKFWIALVEKYPIATGSTAVGTNAAAIGFSAMIKSAIPYLQFISLSFGILIGVLTIIGYYRKYKRGEY